MLPRTSTLRAGGVYALRGRGGVQYRDGAGAAAHLPVLFGDFDSMLGGLQPDTLTASKVDISHCARSARPTTVAFVRLVNGRTFLRVL